MQLLLRKCDGFFCEDYEDGTLILLNKDDGETHVLNESAKFLYGLCEGEISRELVIDEFISEIDFNKSNVKKDEITCDLNETLDDFIKKGIIEEIKS